MTKRRGRIDKTAKPSGASASTPAPAENASPAADGVPSVLHPVPGGADALKWLGACIVMVLAQLEVPGRLTPAMLAATQAERDTLRAYLRADLSFDRLIKDAEGGTTRDGFTPMLPAVNAANRALCDLAFRLFAPAVTEASMRDMAAAELLAGRAWVAPDQSIIRAPANAPS